jgi:predicted nucleic acid-binding protein
VVTATVVLRRRYRLSQWDATILAAAAQLGWATIYSEDMNTGLEVAGMRVFNPFAREIGGGEGS